MTIAFIFSAPTLMTKLADMDTQKMLCLMWQYAASGEYNPASSVPVPGKEPMFGYSSAKPSLQSRHESLDSPFFGKP